jgi:uncharacterized protein (UPF0276 family)
LVDELDPVLVSGHLAWSTHRGVFLNDLLPLPYNRQTLGAVADQVRRVQDALGRPYLIENPATYLGFCSSTMSELEFLAELAAATSCLLLCDVSNVFVSASNMGYDAFDYITRFPVEPVAELHLGGFTMEHDEVGIGHVLIDTHASQIAAPAWDLYAHAVRRFGRRPTLIEWDNQLPDLQTLVAEAAHADRIATGAQQRPVTHAVAD